MTPEGRVKSAIKKLLTRANVWYYMPVQNGMGRVGIPDFICCADGKFLAVEAKAPGKLANLTPNQEKVQQEIIRAAGCSVVVDSVDMLKPILEGVLNRRIE